MASERSEGSGSMGDNWAPSPELLEERELLSGLLDGLSDPAAGASVEEAAALLDPGAEAPPAVVVPHAEASASAVAAQAPASMPASLSPAAPGASAQAGGASTLVSSPGTPAAPGAEHVDTFFAKVAVENQPHADAARPAAVESGAVVQGSTATHAADSKAAEAHAAARGEARVGADVAAAGATGPAAHQDRAVNAPAAGSPSAQGAAMTEGRVEQARNTDQEFELPPSVEEAAQPHMMMAEVSSGERTEETGGQEMPTHEDNQPEEVEAPIERSMLPSDEAPAAPEASGIVAEHETARAIQAGEIRLVEQAEAREDLVSRVSQLFDLVPNWPGVDLDAVEDAARTQVEDGAQLGADLVDMISTADVTYWVTATVGTAVGFGIARRELGMQTRDTADGPAEEEIPIRWSVTS